MTESNPYQEFVTGVIEELLSLAQFEEVDFEYKHLYKNFPEILGDRQLNFLNQLRRNKVIKNWLEVKQESNHFIASLTRSMDLIYGDTRPVIGAYFSVDKARLLKFAEKYQIGTVRGRVQYTDGDYLSDDFRYLTLNGKTIDLMPQGNINNRSVLAKTLFGSYDLSISYQDLKDSGEWSKTEPKNKFEKSIKNAVHELNTDIKNIAGLKSYLGTKDKKVYVRPEHRK